MAPPDLTLVAPSDDPLVPVTRRDALGYPRHADADARGEYDAAIYAPLSVALTQEIAFDAHFAAYALPSVARRLAGEDALELAPVMQLLVLDVEPEGHAPVTPAWWAAERAKLDDLDAAIPGLLAYRTRGGYRVIYRLARCPVMDSRWAAATWSASYLSWCAALLEGVGIDADKSCADWTRLYRLPRVLRDDVAQDPGELIGDPARVGLWDPEWADVSEVPEPEGFADLPEFAGAPGTDALEAAAQALGAAWPARGRHHAAVALSGALARASWPEDLIARFVQRVSEVQDPTNGNPEKRRKDARDSAARARAGDNVTGWPTVVELLAAGASPEVAESAVGASREALGMGAQVADDPEFTSALAQVATEPEQREVRSLAGVEIQLKKVRDGWRKSRDADKQLRGEMISRALRGDFPTDSPDEDRRVAVCQMAEALLLAVPEATDRQLSHVMMTSAGALAPDLGKIIGGVRGAIAAREAADEAAEAPLDEFALEAGGARAGRPIARNQHNIQVALNRLGAALSYDQFAGRKMLRRDDADAIIEDSHVEDLLAEIESKFDFEPDEHYFRRIVNVLCRRNSYHPVLQYLDAQAHDGVGRVGGECVGDAPSWLTTYGGAPDTAYVRAIGRLMLVGAVRRVRHPGSKFQEMCILEGDQGCLKSSALQTLCPNRDWFTDNLDLSHDTKTLMECTAGKWIIEVSELKGFGGDNKKLKSYLSREVDESRMAYGREARRVPRQFVAFASTNDSVYLTDDTGNRRYWPIAILRFDLEALARDRDQLWAEASALEAAHPEESYTRLDPELYAAAEAEQDKRRVEDPYEIVLGSALGQASGRLVNQDVWKLLGFLGERVPSRGQQMQISECMKRLGWTKQRRWVDGHMCNVFERGPAATRERALRVAGSATFGWTIEPVDRDSAN